MTTEHGKREMSCPGMEKGDRSIVTVKRGNFALCQRAAESGNVVDAVKEKESCSVRHRQEGGMNRRERRLGCQYKGASL